MGFARRVKDEVKKIRDHGATRVHLFLNTPVVVGVFAGALLDNGPEVVVYHYFNGTYQPVGKLSFETVNV